MQPILIRVFSPQRTRSLTAAHSSSMVPRLPPAISSVTATVFISHPFNHSINIRTTPLPTLCHLIMIIIIRGNLLNLYTINMFLHCGENYNLLKNLKLQIF